MKVASPSYLRVPRISSVSLALLARSDAAKDAEICAPRTQLEGAM
jgi:hypothetical protein